jgi:hypothetical protein
VVGNFYPSAKERLVTHALADLPTHIVVPDTQCEPGIPMDHLTWIGRYVVDHFAGRESVKLIHLGDHATMASLSSYDKGTKRAEGKRYSTDIAGANLGWHLLNEPLSDYNRHKVKLKEKQWWPERYITLGNHENRITRATEADAQNDAYSLDHLDYECSGYTVVPFLEVLRLDGLLYSHYFVNNANSRPLSGMIETRIKAVSASFVQGHMQGLRTGMLETLGGRRRGIIAGSCYLHAETYRGPQAQTEWRGILVLHNVQGGDYNLMEVDLSYLCRRYEGITLSEFIAEKYPDNSWKP